MLLLVRWARSRFPVTAVAFEEGTVERARSMGEFAAAANTASAAITASIDMVQAMRELGLFVTSVWRGGCVCQGSVAVEWDNHFNGRSRWKEHWAWISRVFNKVERNSHYL